jgi:tRNA(Ile)-lysidine synthase TilS/MesJ
MEYSQGRATSSGDFSSGCGAERQSQRYLPLHHPAVAMIRNKIGIYMERHVLPRFQPESVHWWLSLSGGKDSYAMAEAIRMWYEETGYHFSASGLIIDQWGGPAVKQIIPHLHWCEIHVVDGRALTRAATSYQAGDQAPCRSCADTRRDLTDALIARNLEKTSKKIHFLARGLHLSDTAVSILWRGAAGRNGSAEMIKEGKAAPLTPIGPGVYLAKPLIYAREYETQVFSQAVGFTPSCCGCPACSFPSRRDIAEETVLYGFRTPFWELAVPGVAEYLQHVGGEGIGEVVRRASLPGIESKRPHLPEGLFSFATNHYARVLKSAAKDVFRELDFSKNLSDLGMSRLANGDELIDDCVVPAPQLFYDEAITPLEQRMITALGPFWGAIAL